MVARAWGRPHTFKEVEESVSICIHITINTWELEQQQANTASHSSRDRFHSDLTVSKIQHQLSHLVTQQAAIGVVRVILQSLILLVTIVAISTPSERNGLPN